MVRAVKRLFYVAAGSLAASVATASFGLIHVGIDKAAPVVQAAAILAATAGWLYNNGIAMQMKLREKAFDYLADGATDGRLMAHLNHIGSYWREAEIEEALASEEALLTFYLANRSRLDGPLYHLLRAANVFEEMAILIRRELVEEQVVKDYYQHIFCRFSEGIFPFVKQSGIGPSGGSIERATRREQTSASIWLGSLRGGQSRKIAA